MAHAYCCNGNVSKSAVVVFARELVEGSGRTSSPKVIKVYLLRC